MSSGLQQPDWVEQRSYQREAVRQWLGQRGQGILNMATGTGKTITSLLAAQRVSDELDGQLVLVIAVPYQHLVEQWAKDVRDFSVKPILAYQSRVNWQERLEQEILEFNMGMRDSLTVVTTHRTFAGDSFQQELSRIDDHRKMLIADEVHHLGAPHIRQSLPDDVPLRLGLSATPERWYDDEGTDALFAYFGSGVVFEYSLAKAIQNGDLCEYYYVPHIVELTPDEALEYEKLSQKIGKLASRLDGDLGDADLQNNQQLKQALFTRARLLGTAENKLVRLAELFRERESTSHTLVYCGDGSVEDDVSDQTKRHVDATVELLRTELGIRAKRFTAREDQEERQKLLRRFDSGDLQTLVAIRCLDEGVDVPATREAYILASSSNPRQFVQRRGRILRQHKDKKYAVIHDFIVAPPQTEAVYLDGDLRRIERSLVRKEIERVNLFAEHARNHPDADIEGVTTGSRSLQSLKIDYNLLDL